LTPAELMKRHLRKKANLKLVEAREDLLAAMESLAAAQWGDVETALDAYDTLARQMDDLGLPVEGEAWAERLVISKKGGGSHFNDEDLALASRAHARASALYDFAIRARQLRQRAANVTALSAALEANPSLSRDKRIARLHEAVHAAVKLYRETLEAGAADADQRRFDEAGIPGALQPFGDQLLAALPALAHGAYAIAADELSSLRREAPSSQRFRASRVATIARQALAVHIDLCAQLEHLKHATPDAVSQEQAELENAITEADALVGDHEEAELDDTV